MSSEHLYHNVIISYRVPGTDTWHFFQELATTNLFHAYKACRVLAQQSPHLEFRITSFKTTHIIVSVKVVSSVGDIET